MRVSAAASKEDGGISQAAGAAGAGAGRGGAGGVATGGVLPQAALEVREVAATAFSWSS